jgi:hypothetical protein
MDFGYPQTTESKILQECVICFPVYMKYVRANNIYILAVAAVGPIISRITMYHDT